MISEIEKYVVEAITEYYNNDYKKFFEYLDDNVMWYGPNEGQYVVGKSNLMRLSSKFNSKVTFSINNITTQLLSYSQNHYTLIVTYKLYSKHPDNSIREHLQHLLLTGQKCKDRNGEVFWKCPFIHVSNIIPNQKSNADLTAKIIIPMHSDVKRLVLRGENYSTIYINEDDILYIVGGKGVSSTVYTNNEIYTVHMLLKDISSQLPDYYYRCHSSYIVNLNRIRCLTSHYITLDTGDEVPIPYKRCNEIKNYIDSWMKKQ